MNIKQFFKLGLVAMICILLAPSLKAQTDSPSDKERSERRAEMYQKRTDRLIEKLELTESEKNAFMPIFERYMAEKKSIHSDWKKKDERKKIEDLSDAEVAEIVLKSFDRQEQLLALKRKYFKEFSSVLPAKKVARIFLFEKRNKERKGKMKEKRKGKMKRGEN